MRKFMSVAVAFVAAVLLTGSLGTAANAQSSGLGITPRKDMVVQPGKSVTDQLQIINLSNSQELNLSLQIVDFGSQDETGTPSLRLNADSPQTPWSLRPFIKAPESLTLAPGKTEYIKFTVDIPADQGAGSYYSAIRYVAEGIDGGQVAINASGATLVFVTVPGKTKESLVLQKFGAYQSVAGNEQKSSYRSLFVSSKPKEVAFTVKNNGNVAEQPAGSVLVKNMFGKEVTVVKDANPRSSLALIEQTRRFQTCIFPSKDKNDSTCQEHSWMPGRYTATLSVFYGINGNQTQEITASASFWYLPVWSIIVLAILLIALAGGGYMAYRRFTGRSGFKRR